MLAAPRTSIGNTHRLNNGLPARKGETIRAGGVWRRCFPAEETDAG